MNEENDKVLETDTVAGRVSTDLSGIAPQAKGSPQAEDNEREIHPIATAVEKLINRVEGIEYGLKTYIASAVRTWKVDHEKVISDLNQNNALLKSDDPQTQAIGIRDALKLFLQHERLHKSEVIETLVKGLFLALFSNFDAFMGDLLAGIYMKKSVLFNQLNRSLTISEMLQYESLDDIKAIILQNEIEAFRRKSYVEQFEDLEARFSIKLKAFDEWPAFVECTQRRNLIAHCNGVISDQYLSVCRKHNYVFKKEPKAGVRLIIPPEYFFNSCRLVMKVGVMLGQTLWRKIFPGELDKADEELNSNIYGFLNSERWRMARAIGEFAKSVPNLSTPIVKRMIFVNYVIALKFGGRNEEAQKMLSSIDWSDTPNDFRLAYAVLSDNYNQAAKLMKRIGRKGDYVHEHAYHVWPLFREFRQTEQFLHAYEEIYGYAFVVELQRSASEAIVKADEHMEEERQELEADIKTSNEMLPQTDESDDTFDRVGPELTESAPN